MLKIVLAAAAFAFSLSAAHADCSSMHTAQSKKAEPTVVASAAEPASTAAEDGKPVLREGDKKAN